LARVIQKHKVVFDENICKTLLSAEIKKWPN